VGLLSRKPAAIGEEIKTVLERLCSLEINTIVKDNMTGQKMPAPERALLELAEHYDCKLAEHGRSRLPGSPVTGGPVEFEGLRVRAADVIDHWAADVIDHWAADVIRRWSSDPALSDDRCGELMLLYRIRDTSEQLTRIFEAAARRGNPVGDHASADIAAHPVELTADEIVVLHKAWDLDLEQIALQTVIHLDGDVMHRVSPRCANGAAAPLLSAHDAALRTSISYWKTLVEIVGDFVGGIARTLGQRG
jgi:hypothetical protein